MNRSRYQTTIDSSPLIALDKLDLLPKLSVLFSGVLIPKSVRKEVSRRTATRKRLSRIVDSLAMFQACDEYETTTVELLLIERHGSGPRVRDRGETEAVVQATQVGAAVIVDDAWGRQLADRHQIECHGTIWILEQLHAQALLSGEELRTCFITLRGNGYRLPWREVDRRLIALGLPALPEPGQPEL